MHTFFFSAAFALIFIALILIGYPFARLSRLEAKPSRIFWAPALAMAVLIAITRSLAYVMPIDLAMPWLLALLGLWLIATWTRASVRADFCADATATSGMTFALCILGIVMAVVLCNLPIPLYGAILFEGTSNHDSIYYVTNARWMMAHASTETLAYSPLDPFYSISRFFFADHAPLGRIGSEALLGFVSSVARRDPVYLYNPMQAVATATGIFALYALLPHNVATMMKRISLRSACVAISLALAPAAMQMVLNSNFANAFGTILLTAFVVFACRSRPAWLDPIPAVIFAALLATYAELAPIGLGVVGSIMLCTWLLREATFTEAVVRGVRILCVVALGAIVFFWISSSAIWVIKGAYFEASTQGTAWGDPYAGLKGPRYLVAFLTTTRGVLEHIPKGAIWLSILVVIASALLARREKKEEPFYIGVALGFLVLAGMIVFKEFNYGKMKIAEYFSLFLPPMMLFAVARAPGTRKRWSGALSTLALVLIAGLHISCAYAMVMQSLNFGEKKHINTDLMTISAAASAHANGRPISARFTEQPYFFSMWFTYFAKTPVVFSNDFGGGGYLASYTNDHPAAPFESAPLAVGQDEYMRAASFPAEPVLTRGRFTVIDLEHGSRFSVSGLHANEGPFSWMPKEITITVHGERAKYINAVFAHRFIPESPTEPVTIRTDESTCETEFDAERNEVSFPLPPGKKHTITITARGRAESPQTLIEGSGDARVLTYQVSAMSLSDKPLFTPIHCTSP
ncbi:hypothetical protein FHW69_000455 [Luteibacter sp. Sphag1AF]|uniref:hypothetical protein n=1 Tax=Luteibacter sp. Sphag1AF TaxID=2587031 RepID=UPI00161DCBEF|nr:hypothetical protein [Luteibacter sp. Sphag1AF]MBB3225865.1 hypothetical protein [Luteibacter sp. Sphag1AF]